MFDTASMLAMAREINTDNLARSIYRSDSTIRSFNLLYLPGTMEEAQEIEKECQVKGMDVKLYTGNQATEEQFKQLGEKKSPSIIHIATHGFYFPEEKQKDREDRMGFRQPGKENQFVYSIDPLIRSGLAMTGANHAWKGERIPRGVEDGILTAREVSQLNLFNTELVVLSACQTGLGDVKGSEGVYGLQRAFKMAGARYLLLSLWKVPDETTSEFMVDFYGHLSKGMTIRESYRKTQLEMSIKYPYDPFKWAAFILVE
jgi:CHAT domain-containing protein